jgi:phage repressor protein C with HTH and peptisase S24 domain
VRKGDRVVVKTKAGEVMVATLKRRTAKVVALQPLDATLGERTMAAGDVAWVARIVWASQ